MKFTIVYWKYDRKFTVRFDTLEAAKECANEIFKQTGIIVGIQEE